MYFDASLLWFYGANKWDNKWPQQIWGENTCYFRSCSEVTNPISDAKLCDSYTKLCDSYSKLLFWRLMWLRLAWLCAKSKIFWLCWPWHAQQWNFIRLFGKYKMFARVRGAFWLSWVQHHCDSLTRVKNKFSLFRVFFILNMVCKLWHTFSQIFQPNF